MMASYLDIEDSEILLAWLVFIGNVLAMCFLRIMVLRLFFLYYCFVLSEGTMKSDICVSAGLVCLTTRILDLCTHRFVHIELMRLFYIFWRFC